MGTRTPDHSPLVVNRRGLAAGLSAAAAFPVLAAAGAARAQPTGGSTWDQIKSAGKVRMGVFDFPPYYSRNRASGEWQGALIDMGRDIAKTLKVTFEPVLIGGWDEVVLSLQSNKIDFHLGLQATPQRAAAIYFAGPIYWIQWVAVNNPQFHAKTWADYNKPSVKVAVQTGSADELVLQLKAPQATRVELETLAQIVLAVSSGRADAFTTTVLASLVAKTKNPGLGEFVTPTPRVALPGYAGLRMEEDVRWQEFLNRWAEWNNLLGFNERRMRDSLVELGINKIPPGVSFSQS
ncbi:MAG TPA: transporter substrate-binding domain-containing protein [Stellaceae bacterium]|nr:transporter substrate-binding domain-containing protein [Stellaceae bacterium]